MKNRHLLHLLCTLTIAVTSSSVWAGPTESFHVPLRDALWSISIAPEDLVFRTDYVESDSFRLSRVDNVFRNPVGTLDSVAAMSDSLKTVTRPSDALHLCATWLDMPLSEDTATSPADSITLIHALEELTRSVMAGRRQMKSAFAALDSTEMDSLALWVRTEFGDGPQLFPGGDIFTMRRNEHAERELGRRRLAEAAKVDRSRIMTAALSVTQATERFVTTLGNMSLEHLAAITTQEWNTPAGRVVLGGIGRDRYAGEYAVIIDVGGDDEYLLSEPMDNAASAANAIQVIVDLSGDDTYRGPVARGVYGIGLLVEMSGNDSYVGNVWTQGVGIFGAGLLWDAAGDDYYSATTCSQGYAAFGAGIIADLSGRDVYRTGTYGQGAGATAGIGIVEDRNGHDVYLSGGTAVDVLRYSDHYITMTQGLGIGIRPIASGGIGLLCDHGGNDTYNADIFGQGVAYWLGLGALVDDMGHDRYGAYQYAQGAGVHLAGGYLLDRRGHDSYVSNGVSQGCGHDLSAGILVDKSGDDSYVTEGLSMGGGNANGISLLIDVKGADGYIARRTDVMGYSDFRRKYGMVGVMLDLDGKDQYAAPFGEDGDWWTHSTYGVGADLSVFRAPPARRQPDNGRGKSAEDIARELCTDPDSLFVQASNPVAAYQYLVEPARDSMVAAYGRLITFWAEKLGTESARERHALIDIHQKTFAAGDSSGVPMLIDSTQSAIPRVRNMAVHLLGFSRTEEAVEPLIDGLGHDDWKTRRAAALSLWRLGADSVESLGGRACDGLVRTLTDSVPLVRSAAALAFQTVWSPDAVSPLARALLDSAHVVRYSAELALKKHGACIPQMIHAVERGVLPAADHAMRVIREDTTARDVTLPVVMRVVETDTLWSLRAEAARTLGEWGIRDALPRLEAIRTDSTQQFLRRNLDTAIESLRKAENEHGVAGEAQER